MLAHSVLHSAACTWIIGNNLQEVRDLGNLGTRLGELITTGGSLGSSNGAMRDMKVFLWWPISNWNEWDTEKYSHFCGGFENGKVQCSAAMGWRSISKSAEVGKLLWRGMKLSKKWARGANFLLRQCGICYLPISNSSAQYYCEGKEG